MTEVRLVLIACAVAVLSGCASMQGKPAALPDPALAGEWSGRVRVVVDWCTRAHLPIDLTIHPDATVDGMVGDAVIAGGYVRVNRGPLARSLGWKRDYIIVADLQGPIVKSEGIERASISIPFDLRGDSLAGGAHTSGSKVGGKRSMKLSGIFEGVERSAP